MVSGKSLILGADQSRIFLLEEFLTMVIMTHHP